MERVVSSREEDEEEASEQILSGRLRTRKQLFIHQQWHAKLESFLSAHGFVILFLSTFVCANALIFVWGAREEFMHTKTLRKRWIIAVARGCGYVLNMNCALVIMLAARLTFTTIRDTPLNLVIPFDKSFPQFHIAVGYVITGAVLLHGTFHFVWIVIWSGWGGGLWGVNMCVTTGLLLTAVLLAMVISSVPCVRQRTFRTFYALHNIGAFMFFALLFIHGVYNGVPYTYKWISGPLAVYALDRLARRFKVSKTELQLSGRDSVLDGVDVLRLRVPKLFSFRAGQYAEIKVSSINRFEWHPFTIASAPCEQEMCFYVKAVGDWTKQLQREFRDRIQRRLTNPLLVQVRGPFGAPAQHVGGFQRVVLVSGGVGATPFCAICKQLHHEIVERTSPELPVSSDSVPVGQAEIELKKRVNMLFEQEIEEVGNWNDEDTANELVYSLSKFFSSDVEAWKLKNSIVLSACSSPEASFLPQNSAGKCIPPNLKHTSSKQDDGVSLQLGESKEKDTPKNITHMDACISHAPSVSLDAIEAANFFQAKTLTSRRAAALYFLHSISVNILTFMLLMARTMVLALASIFKSVSIFSLSGSTMFRETWVSVVDLSLGLLIVLIVLASLCAELYFYRTRFFQMDGRFVDVFILVPLLTLSLACGVHSSFARQGVFFVSPVVQFAVVTPLLMILLIYRLHRVMGSRLLLADSCWDSSHNKVRAVDFFWTVPYERDDTWLREELEHLADGSRLRLHRFLTRERAGNQKPSPPGSQGSLTTNYGRPRWDEIFKTIVDRTPSGGKVGVFFCGPKGMSSAIRKALMKIQATSYLRGAYLTTVPNNVLAADLGVSMGEDLERLRSEGSNVRFVFREENFG